MTFTEPTHDLNAVCICGHTARKHHPRSHAHAFTCSMCSCMYMETAPLDAGRPIEEQVADAIRCTTHIDDRLIRARYVIQDLKIRGFVIQRVNRDEHGRFRGGAA